MVITKALTLPYLDALPISLYKYIHSVASEGNSRDNFS